MTIVEVRKMLDKLAKKDGITIDVPVNENPRLRTCLGRVRWWRGRERKTIKSVEVIEFNKSFLATGDKDEIISVIIHEYCHYYLAVTTHYDHGHDSEFKKCCHRHGTNNDKCYIPQDLEATTKYTIKCEKCGKVYYNGKRKCKTLFAEADRVCCGDKVTLFQNW